MKILGIDPGINTGIVLLDPYKGILQHITIHAKDPVPKIRELAASCRAIVIEEEPRFGSSGQIRRLGILSSELINLNLVFIRPAEWKPIAKAQKWGDPILSTDHEHDAYCLALYYFRFKIPMTEKLDENYRHFRNRI